MCTPVRSIHGRYGPSCCWKKRRFDAASLIDLCTYDARGGDHACMERTCCSGVVCVIALLLLNINSFISISLCHGRLPCLLHSVDAMHACARRDRARAGVSTLPAKPASWCWIGALHGRRMHARMERGTRINNGVRVQPGCNTVLCTTPAGHACTACMHDHPTDGKQLSVCLDVIPTKLLYPSHRIFDAN
jgi:hypothetical protein